tara:strand:+ start:3600 stop:3863 length:264 start_codon:yes stop_codon:yes gene_type:complete
MNKPAVLKKLVEYFAEKGHVMSTVEYKAADDTPMRFIVAKRAFGSWNRMTQMAERQLAEMAPAPTPAPAPEPKPKPKAKPAPKKAEK